MQAAGILHGSDLPARTTYNQGPCRQNPTTTRFPDVFHLLGVHPHVASCRMRGSTLGLMGLGIPLQVKEDKQVSQSHQGAADEEDTVDPQKVHQ